VNDSGKIGTSASGSAWLVLYGLLVLHAKRHVINLYSMQEDLCTTSTSFEKACFIISLSPRAKVHSTRLKAACGSGSASSTPFMECMASCSTAQLSLVSYLWNAFRSCQTCCRAMLHKRCTAVACVSHPWNAFSDLPNTLQTGAKQMSMLIQLKCWTKALAIHKEKISGKLVCQVGVTTLPSYDSVLHKECCVITPGTGQLS